MSKLKPVKFGDFTLKKVKISDTGIEVDFDEARVVDDQAKILEHNIKSKDVMPHPDLIKLRKNLRQYLTMAYHLEEGYDMAIKYLKGEQKEKAQEKKMDLYNLVEVTGISIGGDDQLRGVVISGKILSFNKSKSAMNSPRIVFSSDKLGIEQEVEEIIDEIEKEVYLYIFENKKAAVDLFDKKDDDDQTEETEKTDPVLEKVNQAESIPNGLED